MTLALSIALAVLAPAQDSFPDPQINVALAKWGATATASSRYGKAYDANNALDGRWMAIDSDKWNSASNKTPHWLSIDLGRVRTIERVTVRHQGADGHGAQYNTSDFRIQRGESQAGPWLDLVPPIRNNHDDVTNHSFARVATRFVRLLIEKGEPGANQYARIYEVEVLAPLGQPLLGITPVMPPEFRKVGERLEQRVTLEVPPGFANAEIAMRVGSQTITISPTWGARTDAWLPFGKVEPVPVELLWGGKPVLKREWTPTAPFQWGWFAGGFVRIICSSHQDIAWMDSPEACRRQRDVVVITPALKLLHEHPDYRFDLESSMNIMEYLETHPDRKQEIRKLMLEGRLRVGATYNQPYEGLLSGEQLVREFYFGRRWIRRELPGCDSRVAWNPDVPGRAAQMPQIMAKAGVPYLLISRMKEELFRWRAPDGSSVLTYSPGQYGNAYGTLSRQTPAAVERIKEDLSDREPTFRRAGIAPNYHMLYSTDASGPRYFGELATAWNAQKADAVTAEVPPKMVHSTAEAFFDAVAKHQPKLEVKQGERPNVWLYIHGPTHHWAISAKRRAAWLLPAAEAFWTFRCLLDGSFKAYPQEELTQAWADSIFDDHGWGGNQGEITDALFRSKLEHAEQVGKTQLDTALKSLAQRIRPARKGVPIVVFNPLSWTRSEPVECRLPFANGAFAIVDEAGRKIPTELRARRTGDPAGSVAAAFVANNVPSLGYRTYWAVPSVGPSPKVAVTPVIETDHYTVRLAPGGIRSIYDKDVRKEILQPGKFLGGEVFTLRSIGNGAGEFTRVQQPDMDGFDKGSLHKPAWKVGDSGPLSVSYLASWRRQDCTIEQEIRIYRKLKRIDFKVAIRGFNGTRSREFRMAVPVVAPINGVSYETPFSSTRVGSGEIAGAAGFSYPGVDYDQPCKEVHPREVLNYIAAIGKGVEVALSSSVSVCDFIDPTPNTARYAILQPILLASRKSCHSLGNWYLQAGDHEYGFSLTSHASPSTIKNLRFGTGVNVPLIAVVGVTPIRGADRPSTFSFASVSVPNVVVATIKKAEEGDAVVLRAYEAGGTGGATARIRTFMPFRTALHTDILEYGGKRASLGPTGLTHHFGTASIETWKLSGPP